MATAARGNVGRLWACAAIGAILIAFTCALSSDAMAHGGGLNSEGCHNDRRNGGYHCHRGGGGSSSSSRGRVQPLQPRALASAPAVHGDLVRSAQTLLNHLGCDAGAVDGGVGPSTRAAIDRFNQASAQPGASNLVDAALLLRLSRAVSDDVRCGG